MDENSLENLLIKQQVPVQNITEKCIVYRQIYFRNWDSEKKRKRFPAEAHFQIRNGNKGLSVNWNEHCTEQANFVHIGVSHNIQKSNFKNYQDFKIIRLPVSFLRGIDSGIDVIHDPEFKQYPPLIGDPNNSAHALLTYSEEKHNDPEVLIEIVDYVGNNYDNAVFKPDLSSVDNMIDFYNNMFFNKSE